MNIPFTSLIEGADLLPHAHATDAGLDLIAVEAVELPANVPVKVRTGVAMAIPEGHVGLIWDKSSIGSLGVKTLGGVIDAGYRGEVIVLLINLTKETINWSAGKKVAQIIIQPYAQVVPVRVDALANASTRGADGFGSTGVHA
jgi:dUTP pyrophosphatase